MIFNSLITIALKDELGMYNIKNTDIFKLKKINKSLNNLEIEFKNKEVSIKFKCPACGKHHHFKYHVSDMFNQEVIICGCNTLGIPVLFMGNKEKVSNITGKYNEISKKLCCTF